MNYLARLEAIKRIMDDKFTEETPLHDIEILKCEEHDNIIFSATVSDATCDNAIFRFDRNADGTYALTQKVF